MISISCSRRGSTVNHSLVSVSSRLRISCVIVVYAASSIGSSLRFRADSPWLDQGQGPFAIESEPSELVESRQPDRQLIRPRPTRRRLVKRRGEPPLGRVLRPAHHPLGEAARSLDERDVVQHVERLEWRVGSRLANDAGFAPVRRMPSSPAAATVRFQNV